MKLNIQTFLYFAGIAQITLVIGSMAVPKVLNWRPELAKVQPLIKQMFWVYAAYIAGINLCFGLLSIFDVRELTNGSTLSLLVTGFISVYWFTRVLIQFFYFDRTNFPKGKWNKLAEVLLTTLFISFTLIYGWTFFTNYHPI